MDDRAARRLAWPLTVSWILHAALVLVAWLSLVGVPKPPSLFFLELVGADAEPGAGAPRVPEAPRAPVTPPPRLVARSEPRLAAPSPTVAPRPEPPPSPGAALRAEPAEPPSPALASPAVAGPADSSASPAAASTAPAPGTTTGSAAATSATRDEGGASGAAHAGSGGQEGRLVPPGVLQQSPPRYPEAARRAGAQGTTVLRVRVKADGSVGEVVVEQSAGHTELDASAVDAVGRWRFEPARRRGSPVEVWIHLPVRFTLG
jgi:protein TonB